ncbi:MAG: S-layer homology domain-containing protein [Clostridia bacterium]|nr:S-layer homology domain-containing protein [Clostridia bacterium]
MANILKKLVAGISAAAMLATMTAVPVFATETIINIDYTDSESEEWPAVSNVVQSRSDEFGLLLDATGNDRRPTATLTLDTTVSDSSVIEYDFMYCGRGDGSSSINFGNIVSLTLNKLDAATVGGSINGVTYTGVPKANNSTSIPAVSNTSATKSYWSQYMHVKHIVNMESKTVDTTIGIGETIYVEETTPFSSTSATSFNTVKYSFAKYAAAVFKNITISTVDAPSVTMEDINLLVVGDSAKVATITNADSFDVQLTDDTNFSYSTEDTDAGTEVYITVDQSAESGAQTTVTVQAEKDITVKKTITITAKTEADIVQDVSDELVLSGTSVELVDGTEYNVTGLFDLPVSTNNDADIVWSVEGSSYVQISDNSEFEFRKEPGIDGEVATLKAQISYGSAQAEKVFTLNLIYKVNDTYYNENFDDFTAGTIVNLASGSNTNYKASKGMTFSCGTRGDGGGDAIGVIIKDNDGGKYMTIANSNYTGQGRKPVVTLTRKINVYYNLVLKFKARFDAADDELLITDGSSHTLTLMPPSTSYAGKWLDYTIIGSGTSVVSILAKDEEGNPVAFYSGNAPLTSVNTILLEDTNASTVDIDDLYIASDDEIISDADKVAAGKVNTEITDLKKSKDVYTATNDFVLPDAPEGVTVSWKVMQKKKDASEWEDSSFITVSGTSATINPTADIDNYDVKLVATITSGDATDTKDFVMELPNPMDEINGILATDFNVVNTTDLGTDGKTPITFDLKGSEMLKRDLILPLKYKAYKNTTVAWTSSDSSHLAIAEDGTATIKTSDFNAHEVTLTAVVTYKKGSITYSSEPQNFTIKTGFEESDKTSGDATMGKYRVRYDMAYDNNFSAVPSRATTDIKLPTEGYFGSEITWTSSAPTIISNSGKFSKPSSPKTINLAATVLSGSVSETKSFTVSVSGTGSSSGGGGGGGSVSSTGTTNKGAGAGGTIYSANSSAIDADTTSSAEKVAQLQEEALASNDLFKDITEAAWARDEINGLAKAGIINGKTDTLFAPNDTITRAEFAKMLMGTLGLASNAYTTSSFRDVSTDAWYFEAVESAYNLGIITGVGEGIFAPNALITRQDMAVMVERAIDVAGKTIEETAEAKTFADEGSIADYANTAVDKLVKGGVINGMSDTEFAPLANATRAQAAKMLYKLL